MFCWAISVWFGAILAQSGAEALSGGSPGGQNDQKEPLQGLKSPVSLIKTVKDDKNDKNNQNGPKVTKTALRLKWLMAEVEIDL